MSPGLCPLQRGQLQSSASTLEAAAAPLASTCPPHPRTQYLILSLLLCSLRAFGKAPVLSSSPPWSPDSMVALTEARTSQYPTSVPDTQILVFGLLQSWPKLVAQARQVLGDILSFLCFSFKDLFHFMCICVLYHMHAGAVPTEARRGDPGLFPWTQSYELPISGKLVLGLKPRSSTRVGSSAVF